MRDPAFKQVFMVFLVVFGMFAGTGLMMYLMTLMKPVDAHDEDVKEICSRYYWNDQHEECSDKYLSKEIVILGTPEENQKMTDREIHEICIEYDATTWINDYISCVQMYKGCD